MGNPGLYCYHSDGYAIMLDMLLNDVTTNQNALTECREFLLGIVQRLCIMGHVIMTVILLVSLMRLDVAQESCPALCHCMLEILNCSRITNPSGFHRVPLPNPSVPPHPFMYLDFTGNTISFTGKEVWKAYPWTEYLVLKDNNLTRLQNSSLESLFILTYLDLSWNKIQIIERNAFEAVPFLQIIYLSGNVIEWIAYGTFQAWHGLQFLLKVDLSHNPLTVIQDSYFYRLPSLKLLDLGATEVMPRILDDLLMPRILENLLQTSLQLRMLILPQKMSCCLCLIKEDIEDLCKTVKLDCTESCPINVSLCETEEPLSRMQGEVMKALEIRKLKDSSLLNILSERILPNNAMLKGTEHYNDMLELVQNDSSLAANFNVLKSVKWLMQVKADEPLDLNWADKSQLKELHLLVSWLQAPLKETIAEPEKESLEASVQNELSAQVSKESTDEASELRVVKKRHVKRLLRENLLGINQRQKDPLFKLVRDGSEFAKATMPSADHPIIFELLKEAENWKKLSKGLAPQHVLSSFMSHQVALQPSLKHSILGSLTRAVIVDNIDNDFTSLSNDENSKAALGIGLGAQIVSKDDLLNLLLDQSNPPAGNRKSKRSAVESEPSLNELLPDIKLSSVSPPLNSLAPQDNYFYKGDLFEAELNKQLTFLIPNTPLRKLISHVIRILKMDCMEPTIQKACVQLISRTHLLMKLLNKREKIKNTSFLLKTYFWPSKNVANKTTANSRNLEMPPEVMARQGIPEYGSGNKLLLATLVTSIIMTIIAVICLIEICSQRSTAKDRTFLGRKKWSLPDQEHSSTGSLLTDKPPSLRDIYQTQDEMKMNTVNKLYDDKTSKKAKIKSSTRSSLSEPSVKKMSSKTLSVATLELPPASAAPPPPPPPPPPPQPSSTPSQKSSVKKGSDTTGGTPKDTSSKATSSGADEGEDEDEDEEDSVEKSEGPTTEATSEAGESGETEDEDEESD